MYCWFDWFPWESNIFIMSPIGLCLCQGDAKRLFGCSFFFFFFWTAEIARLLDGSLALRVRSTCSEQANVSEEQHCLFIYLLWMREISLSRDILSFGSRSNVDDENASFWAIRRSKLWRWIVAREVHLGRSQDDNGSAWRQTRRNP